ncbi:MAG: hypothetical protein AMXMBFR36_34280 [Acidobacteriota bacterium]
MKLSTVALLGSLLAFAAVGFSTSAVDDSRAAPIIATEVVLAAVSLAVIAGTSAAVGDKAGRMAVVTQREDERRAPPGPADRHPDRSVPAIQVSVDDLFDRSQRALRERRYS